MIDESIRDQEIIGFGASFLEAGMICLNSLDVAHHEQVLRALFDPVKGARFTAMKTVIGPTDFQSPGPYYTYNRSSRRRRHEAVLDRARAISTCLCGRGSLMAV